MRYSLPYWSEVIRRPFGSTARLTHDPCSRIGTEYSSSTWNPGGILNRSTGVATGTGGFCRLSVIAASCTRRLRFPGSSRSRTRSLSVWKKMW